MQRAELRLEGHALEALDARVEALLPVGGPEEGCVREPRTHHALVARHHLRRIGALDVGDRDEPRHQRTGGIAHREVALVILHGGDRHLGRQLEKLRVEAARERHGPLHERRDLVEQRVGNDRLPAEARGLRGDALPDGLAPLVDVREHAAALVQRRDVGGWRGDAQRLRRHEAVAEGQIAGGHAQDLAGHHVPAEQHQHPVHGPHELRLARAPAHAPSDRQRVERSLHDARQQARRVRTRLGTAVDQPHALGRLEVLEGRDLHAAALRERERGLGRRALRVEGGLERRAASLDGAVGLPLGQTAHAHGQAPRRRETFDRAVQEASFVEALADARGERVGEREQRLRRQLLGADLDQEIARRVHARPSLGSSIAPSTRSGASACRSIGKPSASRLA